MSIDNIKVYNDDCFKILPILEQESVDMIFADPPYFLSRGGISCSGGKMVLVDKGKWDKKNSNDEIYDFNIKWISECKRILKTNGSILISGSHHNIYSIGMALLYFKPYYLAKNKPTTKLSCRYFTHSTEYIIWAKKSEKSKHIFNYKLKMVINK